MGESPGDQQSGGALIPQIWAPHSAPIHIGPSLSITSPSQMGFHRVLHSSPCCPHNRAGGWHIWGCVTTPVPPSGQSGKDGAQLHVSRSKGGSAPSLWYTQVLRMACWRTSNQKNLPGRSISPTVTHRWEHHIAGAQERLSWTQLLTTTSYFFLAFACLGLPMSILGERSRCSAEFLGQRPFHQEVVGLVVDTRPPVAGS